ncbi:phosphopantothenoylcysteine decarboxylase-like [Limulus polyphemus]|uniref:Phosphopantothenoylcysteine decarboxylase-like n=1 Tax=Limulus polyphemus TaxID=6850 RepID=A0ABM1C0G4_LIMPO|nr:phosphopantothenoylcysteine decarboxylase-like [Limulus polyphemus]
MNHKDTPMSQTANILIGVTGSVAALKLPLLVRQLQAVKLPKFPELRINLQVVTTERALHFYPLDEVKDLVNVLRDEDEWRTWQKMSDPVLHIELRRWADVLVVSPLDANTMAKISSGICDNLLTCVVRAWDMKKPLVFCPAMNTHMWDHPITVTQIEKLKELGYIEVPCVAKKLACGDSGYGAMAEVPTIVETVVKHLQNFIKYKIDEIESSVLQEDCS